MITHLVDTSAAARLLTESRTRAAWQDQLAAGTVAICDAVEPGSINLAGPA